ncbi:hypothetical protein J4E89_001642 [Alternaria sp. Ai002NY15]|nr:hypothetical protein J4E89_001642 [Alternaria sp. Ai002NY15]
MARLNETADKDAAAAGGADPDTQTQREGTEGFSDDLGDFENDPDLDEAEKAQFRQERAAALAAHQRNRVRFGDDGSDSGGDKNGDKDGHEGDEGDREQRRRASRRQSLKQAVDPRGQTFFDIGYDDETDAVFIRLFDVHPNGEEEILADIRTAAQFHNAVKEHPKLMFAYVVDVIDNRLGYTN